MFTLQGPADGNRSVLLNPSLENVLDAVNSLDGCGNSGMLLRQKDENAPYLGIAGGERGLYVVFIAVDGAWAKHVVDNDMPKGEDDYRMKCGGQKSDMDRHFLIGRDEALRAAEYFYRFQLPNPDLDWEET